MRNGLERRLFLLLEGCKNVESMCVWGGACANECWENRNDGCARKEG